MRRISNLRNRTSFLSNDALGGVSEGVDERHVGRIRTRSVQHNHHDLLYVDTCTNVPHSHLHCVSLSSGIETVANSAQADKYALPADARYTYGTAGFRMLSVLFCDVQGNTSTPMLMLF